MWNRLLPEFRWCVPVMISRLIGGDGKAPLWKLCSIKRQTVKWCSAPCLEICVPTSFFGHRNIFEICVPTRSYSLRNIFEIFEICVPTCSLSLRKIFVNIWYMCANVNVLFRSRKILRIQFKLNTALLSHCPCVRPSQAWHLTFLRYIKA